MGWGEHEVNLLAQRRVARGDESVQGGAGRQGAQELVAYRAWLEVCEG